MSIGGTNCGAGDVRRGTNDFVFQLQFTNPGGPQTPTCAEPHYSCGNVPSNAIPDAYTLSTYSSDFWIATGGTSASVPEPATPSLLGPGHV